MDVFDKNKRSWIMSRVKGKDTKPEIIVRSIVHKLGCRFRKNIKTLPGSPDIVLKKHRKIIFVHGCFWHGHNRCKRAALPDSNIRFWQKKLAANILRDKRNIKQLMQQGWKVLVVWECQIKNEKSLILKLTRFLNTQKA